MKKSLLIVISLACLCMLSPSVWADDGADKGNKFGLGAEISLFKSFDYNVDNAVDTSRSYDPAAMYGGNLTYYFNHYFSTELTVAHAVTDVELKSLGVKIKEGELEQTPIMLTLRAHMPSFGFASFYAGGGLTYYVNDFDMSSTLERQFLQGTKVDPDDGLGFHVNGGVELFATDNLAFDIDLKYTWYREEFVVTIPKSREYTELLELDSFSAGLGLKLYF